ncbi:MAG: hypothetical protein U0R72_06295 [Nakamurella multipartita]
MVVASQQARPGHGQELNVLVPSLARLRSEDSCCITITAMI